MSSAEAKRLRLPLPFELQVNLLRQHKLQVHLTSEYTASIGKGMPFRHAVRILISTDGLSSLLFALAITPSVRTA